MIRTVQFLLMLLLGAGLGFWLAHRQEAAKPDATASSEKNRCITAIL